MKIRMSTVAIASAALLLVTPLAAAGPAQAMPPRPEPSASDPAAARALAAQLRQEYRLATTLADRTRIHNEQSLLRFDGYR